MAKTYCIVSILYKEVFDKLHSRFPGSFVELIKKMRFISNVQPTVSMAEVSRMIMRHFEEIEAAYTSFAYKHGTLDAPLS